MTREEDKELLLIDLSARLPYGVMCNIGLKYPLQLQRIFVDKLDGILLDFYEDGNDYQVYLGEVKPYLRPLSSMTEEEAKELLFIRLDSKYDESCANSIKLVEVSFQKKPPYKGSISVWFSFENKIHDICSGCEYLGRKNDITLAEIDWLNAHRFDYRGLIERGLAIDATGLGIY